MNTIRTIAASILESIATRVALWAAAVRPPEDEGRGGPGPVPK